MKYLKLFEDYESQNEMPESVVDIISGSPQHETLTSAIEAAELIETLQEGIFTVFAPVDSAFDQLPEGTLEDLLENIPDLADILKYHVVEGKVSSSELEDGQMIMTIQGQELEVTIEEDEETGETVVMINGAVVTKADIESERGMVHIIDGVLLPEEKEENEEGAQRDSDLQSNKINRFESKSTSYKKKTSSYKNSGLKNPEKADLDKNKKLTSYEKKRGKAIEDSIDKQKLTAAQKKLPLALQKAILAKKK